MSVVVLVVEGVLVDAHSVSELAQAHAASPAGVTLLTGLAKQNRVLLATRLERRLVTHWCRRALLDVHDGIVPLDDQDPVGKLRGMGETIDLWVDSDPDRAAAVLREGVTTLLFAKPVYARSAHRPDLPQLRRPWTAMVGERDAQQSARRLPVHDDVE